MTSPRPSPRGEGEGSYSLLSISSPKAGEDLSAAKEIRIGWESLLGDGVDFSILYSRDGKAFDQEIASKLTGYEYTWKPDALTLAGWVKVKAFRDGYVMGESVVPVSLVPPTSILVSKADQKVFHFSGGKLKGVFTCSTALPKYDLEPGNYRVYLRERRHWSKKWEVWMPHALFFHAGYALHATTALRRLGHPASHGCIRLRPRDAEKLYGAVTVGTPVIVLPESKPCAYLQSFYAPEQPLAKQAMAAKGG